MVQREQVVGSTTACIVTLDHESNQLQYANIGDSGVIILRHIQADLAGTVSHKINRQQTSGGATDLRITFLSQQQLRSFNFPYQLGYAGPQADDDERLFETPMDAHV